VRERPLGLKPGLARLAEIAPKALFLPLALEYGFWTERGAEAFLAFGPARTGEELIGLEREARLARLEDDLTATLDRLGGDVMTRDPARFRTLLEAAPGSVASMTVGDDSRRCSAAVASTRPMRGGTVTALALVTLALAALPAAVALFNLRLLRPPRAESAAARCPGLHPHSGAQ
jgi:hypothetical protein